MLIRIARGWELPEGAVTPEAAMLGRRTALGGSLAGAVALGLAGRARAADTTAVVQDPATNPAFVAGRATTPEDDATSYNNFYEFGETKSISRPAQKLPLSPWTVSIDGLVESPMTLGLDDLERKMPLEQRVYRHRCVEAWAMTVPWTGFALAELVKLARPLSSAKFVTFTTAELPKVMPGLRQSFYPWPYTEGVTMAEATNPLPFLVTGMYGKPLPPQNGGPFRLALPWKYGFKSAKSIVKISFTDTEPHTFWEAINPDEYGFWANVNPAVPHPRWSQASERLIGSDERVPTQLYNGYGEFVASLYPDTTTRKYFM